MAKAAEVTGMKAETLTQVTDEPDGTWKRIKDMTPKEKASVHWPAGGD